MSRHELSVPAGRLDTGGRRPTTRRWRTLGYRAQVWVLTSRSLRNGLADPKLLLLGLLQPVVLLLLFSQVFQSIGTLPGVVEYRGYINFLMPATLVNIALTTAMSAGAGLLTEVYTGFAGRLRTMPIALSAVLVARTVTDAVRLTLQLVVAVLAAVLLLGFRPSGLGLCFALGLTVFTGWGLSWVFVALATWQRRPEVLQAVSFVVMFPLMFGSSAYLPVAAMPEWLRVISAANPVTYAVDATRALATARPTGSALGAAIALVAVTALAGAYAATRNFRRTGQV